MDRLRSAKRKGEAVYSTLQVHDIVDGMCSELERKGVDGMLPTCTKGCAHCCHIEVQASPDEAAIMVRYARHHGHAIDAARVKRQAEAEDFTALPLEDRRCVFLKGDNTCAVHRHRPNACRKFFVMDGPEACDTVANPGGRVGILNSIEAETLASAYMTVFGSERLAKVLKL